ncbi:ComEC/Rec2 family competence protein [Pedobacter gandavensis]|uniref:ComEC/Rec2 family competence protein n=1 Tax=Pedobacter gandavensis TaxID=2679963 RepID=UPI00292EC846|nr:ComEC/Rec2 family competence protein [Pedobacter gandavensis]
MSSSTKPTQIFLRILLPYTLGLLIFYHFKHSGFLYVLLAVNLFLLLCLLLINKYYKVLKAYQYKDRIGLAVQIFLFFFGGVFCYHHQMILRQDHFSKLAASYLKVQVIDDPQLKAGLLKCRVEVLAVYQPKQALKAKKHFPIKKASGMMTLSIRLNPTSPLGLKYGSMMIIPAQFKSITAAFHPAIFDHKSWLATQNIHHQSFLRQHQVFKLRTTSGNRVFAFAINLRAQQVNRYHKLLQDKSSVALVSTLVLGYRMNLSKETMDIYSKTGTIHALSVSGMHVGLIYLILNRSLTFLNRKRSWKTIKLLFIIGLLWFYTLLTGCAPSVLRAVIMLTVLLIGQTNSRTANSYNILSFTAFVMLLYEPFLIWDIGFQLSFLAVLGIIYLQAKLEACCSIKNPWIQKLWSLISISVAAQLFSTPLSIYYFHQFPVYFLLSNLFILLPITLIMYLGILILIPGLDFLAPILNWLILFNHSGLEYLAALPYSSLTGIWINKTSLILGAISLTLFVLAIVKHHVKLLMAAFALFLSFQVSLSRKAINSYHQRLLIQFSLQKRQSIISIFSHQAIIYTHLKTRDPAFQYFIQPILDDHQIWSVKIKQLPP